MKINIITSVLILLFLYQDQTSAIVINELVAENKTTASDADHETSDWLELYNDSDADINLAGWSLADDGNPGKWVLPDFSLSSKDFMLIWCSNKNCYTPDLHTNFKLSGNGERITLFRADDSIADSLTYPALRADVSYARYPDGAGTFVLMTKPTPERANIGQKQTMLALPPTISHSSGRYDSSISVKAGSPIAEANIVYTLDASLPTASSPKFTNNLTINKTTVLRARMLHPDMTESPVVTRIYFIGENPALFELPILSLTADPKDMWDPSTGIYANPQESGDEWERPVSVAYLEKGALGFTIEAGVRMHGGASRFKSEKKSFRLYFRSQYGPSQLDYPILPSAKIQSYNRLVLRASFNDCWTHWWDKEREAATYHRDQIMRDLFLSLGYPAAHGDYAHLFLNGEYWGLYNISERYDSDFFSHYVGAGEYDVVKPGADENGNAVEAGDGDIKAWQEFETWFVRADFRNQRNYDEFKRRVDINNFIDFYLFNIWAQNGDWPRHNWYAFREKSPQARWVFLPWDTEYSFGGGTGAFEEDINIFQVIEDQAGNYAFCRLLSNLKKNNEFAQAVVERFRYFKAALLNASAMSTFIDRRSDQIRPAMPFEAERWGSLYSPDYFYDEQTWEQAVLAMRKFSENRSRYVQQHLAKALPNQVAEASTPIINLNLAPGFPNPFNQSVRLAYTLPAPMALNLTVYNINGKLVRRLLSDLIQGAGEHAVVWDGADESGQTAAGIYIIRLETADFSATRKVSLVK